MKILVLVWSLKTSILSYTSDHINEIFSGAESVFNVEQSKCKAKKRAIRPKGLPQNPNIQH